jgi:hypothetical protein
VAYKDADDPPGSRVVVTGTITEVSTVKIQGVTSSRYVLDDGIGQLNLLFLGRPKVAGPSFGICSTAEGTARLDHDRLVVWNPVYRIEPPEPT